LFSKLGGVEMSERCGERDRIEAIDVRLRSVEQACLEMATMSKVMRAILIVLCMTMGIDIQGMI
jgi:hypothetical protein